MPQLLSSARVLGFDSRNAATHAMCGVTIGVPELMPVGVSQYYGHSIVNAVSNIVGTSAPAKRVPVAL
jgi:hypothetical protein